MADYYQLLGIKQEATLTEIRAAYKKLAMLYHPDRNPNNPEAEELFKLINEAYHVLADPAKRTLYNAGINYPQQTYHSTAHDTSAYWKQYHHQRYEQWRQAQQSTYKFDQRYFKIQALAIGVFLFIAGVCFAVINVIQYFHEQNRIEIYEKNMAQIEQVNILFYNGQEEKAFSDIRKLQREEPLEYMFSFAEDSLIFSLRKQAENEFQQLKFENAKKYFKLLEQYEQPVRDETLQRVAECEYFTGSYEEALLILKKILDKQPGNISLIHRIAKIYQEDIQDYTQALYYLTLGKKNFKAYMTHLYGEAFELMMNPAYVHDIYFDIFIRRAAVNLTLQNYEEAETDCSWAIILRPAQAQPYYNRAVAVLQLGRKDRVCDDLYKAQTLGYQEAATLRRKKCSN